MTILKIDHLNKYYMQGEEKIHALKDFSATINDGEVVSIVGKSGCGKTTLLKIISGILKPSEGSVLFGDTDIASQNRRRTCEIRRKKIGFVFQNYELIRKLTVYENIVYPLLLDKKQADKTYLKEICENLQIADKMSRFPQQLSGGEQQRVSIARAIITRPELLLCDEPTGNLDPDTAVQVMDMLTAIQKKYGMTMLLVTHDKDIAAYGQRTITL